MDPCTTAGTSTSTLSGAFVQTSKDNEYINTGGNMRMVKVEQNVTVNRCCTAGNCASEVREDARSGPIVTTNVFGTLATVLRDLFGLKASETNLISSGNIPQQSVPNYDARDHSQPRATVTEITDMMASFDSTASSLTRSSSSERYIRSMLECNEGYPLFEPEPESQEGIRVGDVGLVTEDGGFDFLFNVCPSPDISTNPTELPDGFQMLRSPEILEKIHFQSETHLFSNGVKRTKEPDAKYICSGPEGGVLELPSGATRFGAKNKLSFKDLATRHAENWYRYTVLTRGRDAPNGSLYIVTSCIKCTDWGIAVFNRTSNPEDYLRFITSEDDQTEQSKYEWTGAASIRKVASNQRGPSSNDADSPNHCVFLRGYKIMLHKDIWHNIKNSQFTGTPHATASSYRPHAGNKPESLHQGDSNNQDDPSQNRADSGPGSDCGTNRAAQNTCTRDTSARVILYEYSKTSPAHPSDFINAILLCQEPKAKVALTHDDDWCDLLQYHSQVLHSGTLTNISLLYTSNLDEYGCACLKRSDLNPGPDVTSVESNPNAPVTSTLENHLQIDSTQPSLSMEIDELPTGDDLALLQQDYWHPFNVTTRISTPHSQSSHHIIPTNTTAVGSDVNHAFPFEQSIQAPCVQGHYSTAAFSGQPMSIDSYLAFLDGLISDGTHSPMTEEEYDEVPEHDYMSSNESAGITLPDDPDKYYLPFDVDGFSHLGGGQDLWSTATDQSDKFDQFHLTFDGNGHPQPGDTLWSLSIPANGAAATSTATDQSDKSHLPVGGNEHSQPGDSQGLCSVPIPASRAAGTSTTSTETDQPDKSHLPFSGNEFSHLGDGLWAFPIPSSGAAGTSTETDQPDKFHLPFGGHEFSHLGDSLSTGGAAGPSTDQSDNKSDKSHLPFGGNEFSHLGADLWSWPMPTSGAVDLSTISTAADQSDKFEKFYHPSGGNEFPHLGDGPWSFHIPPSGAAQSTDKHDNSRLSFEGNKLDTWFSSIPSSGAVGLSTTSMETDQPDKFHLHFDTIEHSQPDDTAFWPRCWSINDPSSQSPVGPSVTRLPVIKLESVEDDLTVREVGSPRIQYAAGKRRKKEGAYQCPFSKAGCNATFITPHNLRYHINAHLGQKPYKCDKCSYAASSPATMKRHKATCQKVQVNPQSNA